MQNDNKPLIVIYKGTLAGTRWPVDVDCFTMGRDRECSLVLPERQVSRYHTQIERDADGYLIRDLGSKNGTFVNGEPVREQPYRLQDGDEISLALTVDMGFVAGDATLPLEDTFPSDNSTPSGLEVDRGSRRVCLGRAELDPPLSPAQFRLLTLLIDFNGEVVTRDDVIKAVWPDAAGGVTDQAVDALVYRLRERLVELDPDYNYVVTVRGHGFRFETKEN
ncbi:MAG: FHA domain-containing protein [Anaerolineae bacterium]|nr:FHA domain-containing protein [Anaerolineae bacterium]